MKLSREDLILRKKLYFIMALVMGIAYTLCCFAISPLLVYIGNDIAFEGTVLPILLDYVGRLVEIVAISAAYAVLICGAFRLAPENFKLGIVVFAVATLYKYTANVTMDWIINGSVPAGWIWDVVNVLFYTALEMVQLLIVWAIIKHFAARIISGGSVAWYPFDRFYDKNNPCLRAAFFSSLTVFLSKIFGRVINDIYSLIIWGLPQKGITWVIMAAEYVFEMIFGLLCYVVIIFTLTKLMDKLLLKSRED